MALRGRPDERHRGALFANGERPRRVERGLHRLTQIGALTNGIFCDRGATSSDDNDDDPSRDGDNIRSSESL